MIDPLEHSDLIAEAKDRFRSRCSWSGLTPEDLEQAAWIGLLTAVRRFDGQGNFRGFAQQQIYWAMRQEIRRTNWFRIDHGSTAASAAAIRMRRRDCIDQLPAADPVGESEHHRPPWLDMLSPRQAEVIELRLGLDGGSGRVVAAVAELLGISVWMVEKHERRALAKLRKAMSA